ncbi:amino acid adenylation domain-containing protein [Nocardia sp. NBC_00565]|uniref:amino acid adenylation domain-containing protein n=1 Tax=Nocardia sp. NBC_00565 TaxID=2975993 RepID=UPI002E819EC9|nr:amino acid adenylation domain-containing protein [Nocardia sp. NBC_00565]WUC02832.1 amino acid adenylation domain-containing protein [Nocardia sp. NBC_00565]
MTTTPEIEDVLALSPLQEGFFSLAQLADGGADMYAMQFVNEIIGPVDAALLRRSIEALLERHPNLRVSFWDRDIPKPVQIVPTRVELPWFECRAELAEFDAICAEQRRHRFDLTRGPAVRVVLVTLPDGRRRMIFTAHHILMDGWSIGVFCRELVAVYEAGGRTAALPEIRPYRDYIGWLAAQDTDAAVRAWADYLGGSSGPLMLAEGAVSGGAPKRNRLRLNATETAGLTRWVRAGGLTLNTAVQFAWAVVLARLTGRRDVIFGTIVAGRPETFEGIDSMVGLFINTVPIAVRLDPAMSVAQHCTRLQRESVTMRDIGYLSLSTIHRAVSVGALFDTLLVFENAPLGTATETVTTANGVSFVPVTMESLTHYPLTVVCYLLDGTLEIVVEAVPGALPHLSAAEVGERLVTVLRQLAVSADSGPYALDVLLPNERARLIDPAPVVSMPSNPTVPQLFAAQVAATPNAPALTTATETYTYAELDEAVSGLAGALTARGIGAESVVVLAISRSAQSIVAILAVLAAGGAYVPVDVTAPTARINSMLRQSDPALIVTVRESRSVLDGLTHAIPIMCLDDAIGATDSPRVEVHPDQSAYVIFTSGSTGEPKGVVGTHAALVSYFADHRERVYRPAVARVGRKLRIAHAWSMSFDASWQPLVGLLDGHTVHLFDFDEMRDARRLVEGIATHDLDMIDTSPSMYAQLSAAGMDRAGLSVLALGGEAIDERLWAELQALPDTDVFNCYGPTETTVEAVVASVTGERPSPTIGSATAGMAAYVLDPLLLPVPAGVVGELYLSGGQVTRGYVGKPGMTSSRFVADPYVPGARMYRTGDLVRRKANGDLAYLGRADDQVKIRGHRIEIGEIETALRRLPGVEAAAVVVVRRESGPVLVGFVTGEGAVTDVRDALADHLPAYMMPARIVALPALPLTPNGKLDTRGLTERAHEALGAVGVSAPETETERVLCAVFAELLDGVTPGIDDDFFALGVDSIVAISLVNTMRRRGLTISPRMVLSNPTVRRLAAAIERAAETDRAPHDGDYGDVAPLPLVSWMYEQGTFRRFAQSALIAVPADLDRASLEAVLQAVLDAHDMLRSQLNEVPGGYRLATREPGSVRAEAMLSSVEVSGELGDAVTANVQSTLDGIDPFTGQNVRAIRFVCGDRDDVLLLTIHHLAIDIVSWQILFADLAEAAQQLRSGATPKVMGEFTGYRRWAELLHQRAATSEVGTQRDYWARQLAAPDPVLGRRLPDPATDTWSTLRLTAVHTPVSTTRRILGLTSKDEGIREFLLAALTITLATWRARHGQSPTSGALVALYGHGREDDIADGADTSRTVGWFTTLFPARFGVGFDVDVARAESDPAAALAVLESVSTHIAAIPHSGMDFGLLCDVERVPELRDRDPQVEFNYLGRLDLTTDRGSDSAHWARVGDLELTARLPLVPEPDFPLRFALGVSAAIGPTEEGTQLVTYWRWSDALFTESQAQQLADIWQRAVAALARACG